MGGSDDRTGASERNTVKRFRIAGSKHSGSNTICGSRVEVVVLYGSSLGNLTSREAYDGPNVFNRNSKTYSGAYAGSQAALVATLHG